MTQINQKKLDMHEDDPWHAGTSEIGSNEVRPEDATKELEEAPLELENGYKEKDRNEYIESVLETRLR